MHFKSLSIHHLRNIDALRAEFHPEFNLILGDNGSGKTSVIEALYLLAVGRSFRTHLSSQLVQKGHDLVTVFSELSGNRRIGIEKSRQGKTRLRLDQSTVHSSSEIASLLPVQLLYQDIFALIDAGPTVRRSFLEWGLFHQDPEYFSCWKKYKRVLKQRNSLLRQQASRQQFTTWDEQLSQYAADLSAYRLAYLDALQPLLKDVLQQLSDLDIRLKYLRGWGQSGQEQPLLDMLQQQYERDAHLGYTQSGAHRADLSIQSEDSKAKGILSRGQQKLVLIALKLAQGLLLQQTTNKACVYLIDDVCAELDAKAQLNISRLLGTLKGQIFLTAVDSHSAKVFSEHFQGQTLELCGGAAYLSGVIVKSGVWH